jgi:hypothetical protein
LLAIVVTAFSVFDIFAQTSLLSVVIMTSCAIGIALSGYFFAVVRYGHPPLLDKKIASVSLYYCLALVFGCLWHYSNIYLSSAILSIAVSFLLRLQNTHPSLQRNAKELQIILYASIATVCLLSSILNSAHSSLSLMLSATFWLISTILLVCFVLFQDKQGVKPLLNLITSTQRRFVVHHLMLTISLFFLLDLWQLNILFTPCLIVQGSYLFFARKQSAFMNKFALAFMFVGLLKLGFIDAANALLWQKVILMIGIGGFMLAAAFVYQKRLNKAS